MDDKHGTTRFHGNGIRPKNRYARILSALSVAFLSLCATNAYSTDSNNRDASTLGRQCEKDSGQLERGRCLYTVGGIVSGLEGSGLILKENNDEQLRIKSDGAYHFDPVTQASVRYRVTIAKQPSNPKQNCTIANGQGYVSDAAAQHVDVQCTTMRSTVTVGGTVQGLQGSGLVLSDAAGGSVTVNTNGSFLLPNSFVVGTAYSVTVATEPTQPAQYCRLVGSTGAGIVGSSNVTNVQVECLATRSPPTLRFCEDLSCTSVAPVSVKICPTSQPDCSPNRSTRLQLRIDGIPVSGGTITLNQPAQYGAVFQSGNGSLVASFLLTVYDAPYVMVYSDVEVSFTYYNVAPVWGGITNVDFVSTLLSNATMDEAFYRHVSYDVGSAAQDLLDQASAAIVTERNMVNMTSEKIDAYFTPTELVNGGEGNLSFGNGIVTINYGNPPYVAYYGGILNTSIPRFAHENTHELFNEIRPPYLDNNSCLNEGVADALAFASGFLPEADFGPVGLRGLDFEVDKCLAMNEMHDIGNCPLWNVKKQGLLTPTFLRGLFHPQHNYSFDSCALSAIKTGNSLYVLFTEAGGVDAGAALDAAGIPHATSYSQALTALGF